MSRSSPRGSWGALNRVFESPWFAYAAIILLQLKVMLWVWMYRDLPTGDTSSYYSDVFAWLDGAKVDLIWSPIYTGFLAILHFLIGDSFWVLVIARILIATCASILVLALFRRLLPKPIAWLLAAWWALLPINFDTLYSVHLFSALFPFALFLVAVSIKNCYGRGVVAGGLLLTAVLVRNEYSALFVLLILSLIVYEFYASRRHSSANPNRLVAYGLPLVAASLVILFFYAKTPLSNSEILKEIEAKHQVNVCQIYAFNRLQQGDPWRGNPWTDCQSILTRDFGRTDLSFSQAFFLNPRAILEHIWWNVNLIPSGTQLALFNYYAGGPNPDYVRARQSPLVWIPFFIVLGLSAFAAATDFIIPILKRRQSVENGFAWFLMFSSALLVVGLMMMQRPRPSYMFPYTLFIMGLTGLGLHRLQELARLNTKVLKGWPVAAVLLILLVPPYYDADYINHFGYQGQPYRKAYERIVSHVDSSAFNGPVVLVTPTGDETLCNYLGLTDCAEFRYGQVAGPNFKTHARDLGVNWIYLDGAFGLLSRRSIQ